MRAPEPSGDEIDRLAPGKVTRRGSAATGAEASHDMAKNAIGGPKQVVL
jgi:hypothetical protein